MAEHNADSPWGVRHQQTKKWTGCLGSVGVSHHAALTMERAQPILYKAERNPADVLADELAELTDEMILKRAEG
jgi:hypothetical protein